MDLALIGVLFLVLCAEFVNGWNDAPNAIATVVSTRVLSFQSAIFLAVSFDIIGTMIGTAVATTIGKGIVDANVINLSTIAAALISVALWNGGAAYYGIPTSSSHALVAGLSGAALASAGPDALLWIGWRKVLIGLVCSTIFGFIIGLIIAKGVRIFFSENSPIRSKVLFDRLQIISASFMALNHGLNDGQKFIGVFTLTLVLGGFLDNFSIPWWVILTCAFTMGAGTFAGGRKIIQTLGMKLTHMESWQGFSAETGAGITILTASFFGIPLSTTHTISTSIMGVGASKRRTSVKLSVAEKILKAWLITFPACGTIAFISTLIFEKVF
ncbi:anion permease [Patescibacteria group bacterium]